MYTINNGLNKFARGNSTEWADIDTKFNPNVTTETNATILVLVTINQSNLYLTTDRMHNVNNKHYGIQYRIIVDDQETSSFVNHHTKYNAPMTIHRAVPVENGIHTIKIQYKLPKDNMEVTWTESSKHITIMVVPS